MFTELRNTIDFYIRSKIKVSRKNYTEKNTKILMQIERENNYTKDILQQYFQKSLKKTIKILDIGSKNWFYAKGEYSFFKEFCSNIELHGVEVDAYRLYTNFYNRFEAAKFFTKGLENTIYIPDNLLNLNDKYDYIIWFLPFVFVEPHSMWGLPKRLFYPQKLLLHAYNLLAPEGQMLIINQGLSEYEEQKKILKELQIYFKELSEVKSNYFEYKNKRYGILITKS